MGITSRLLFWRRDSHSKLIKLLYEKYLFNMLSIPREGVLVGDIYPGRKNEEKLYRPINIKNFLNCKFEMPIMDPPQVLTDIADEISDSIDAKIGLSFLENFLN